MTMAADTASACIRRDTDHRHCTVPVSWSASDWHGGAARKVRVVGYPLQHIAAASSLDSEHCSQDCQILVELAATQAVVLAELGTSPTLRLVQEQEGHGKASLGGRQDVRTCRLLRDRGVWPQAVRSHPTSPRMRTVPHRHIIGIVQHALHLRSLLARHEHRVARRFPRRRPDSLPLRCLGELAEPMAADAASSLGRAVLEPLWLAPQRKASAAMHAGALELPRLQCAKNACQSNPITGGLLRCTPYRLPYCRTFCSGTDATPPCTGRCGVCWSACIQHNHHSAQLSRVRLPRLRRDRAPRRARYGYTVTAASLLRRRCQLQPDRFDSQQVRSGRRCCNGRERGSSVESAHAGGP
jgi:hypothetical protein